MAITKSDIKLMASQRLADTDDGGGRMTGIEIVDGNVNNLFPDISRLDRVYGRVSLRKAFMGVFTDNQDTYYGSHLILTDPPDDPLIHACLFTTGSPSDQRTEARDRVESYVTQGTRYGGWLWNNQLEGARSLLLFADPQVALPQVGDVWYLVEREGLSGEYTQYVRITSVEAVSQNFYVGASFTRRVLTVGIGDPLAYTFHGVEVAQNDNLSPLAKAYTSQVADAAQYFGVMRLTEAASQGDLAVQVDSIYTHLVPSAQAESPVTDVQAGSDVAPLLESGVAYSFTAALHVQANAALYTGSGIKPGSLTIAGSGYTWTDDSAGNLARGGVTEGVVDYGTGGVTWASSLALNVTQTWTVTATSATKLARVSDTHALEVTLNNRGYNWTATLRPIPAPGTLVADYMAQGKWYRLRDNGRGELVGAESGLGTGAVNFATGSVTLTCGALPDANSLIIFSWGTPTEYTARAGDVSIQVPGLLFTLPQSVEPSSLAISWLADAVEKTATDNGSGQLTGDGTGQVVYANGTVFLKPAMVPDPDSEVQVVWDYYSRTTASVHWDESGDHTLDFSLTTAPIKPGTVEIVAQVATAVGHAIVVTITDDGVGGLVSTLAGGASGANSRVVVGLAAGSTINYTTGAVHLVGAFTGTEYTRMLSYSLSALEVSGPAAVYGGGAFSGPRMVYTGYGNEYEEDATVYLSDGQDLVCNYSGASVTGQPESTTLTYPALIIDLLPLTSEAVVPGSLRFTWAGHTYVDRAGVLYRDVDPLTDSGLVAGTVDYTAGTVTLTDYVTGTNNLAVVSLLSEFRPQALHDCQFRTPGAPLRPGSFYVQANTDSGELLTATADFNGVISGDRISGTVDSETGIAVLSFGEMVVAAGHETEPWYNATLINGTGQIWRPTPVLGSTIRYNCVVYAYLPLDAGLLGLNPVRLPSDGRVPVVKTGNVVVIHHTLQTTLSSPLTAGQVLTLPRGDLSLIELYDADGLYVPAEDTYAVDLVVGSVTMATPLVLTGFAQPLVALHRREDMALVGDVQINGQLTLVASLGHDYPVPGSYVSSALLFGDLAARVYGAFDQQTWTNVWSNALIGNPCTANYNEVQYPLVTTNRGAIEERWALIFDSSTHFNIVGEQVGIIGSGYTTNTCAPINPATLVPYFTIDLDGWGAGWATGNVFRFNTTAANAPVWVARTTLSGPVTEPDDQFTIQIRGDAD